MGFLKTFQYYIFGAVIAALLIGLGAQTVRLANSKTELATEQAARAKADKERADVALAATDEKRKLEQKHAQETIDQEAKYAEETKSRDARNAALVADNQRLRGQLNKFTTSSRLPGETDAAFCQRQGDRLATVGGLLAEGVELEAESRRIIERRDAEVRLLFDQIKSDRLACSPTQ